MNRDVGIVAKAEGEFAGERGVELNAVQASAAWGKQTRDGSVAGTDLDDRAVGDIAERVGDADAGILVNEEILAEFGFLCH
jgi:hypothetical protein